MLCGTLVIPSLISERSFLLQPQLPEEQSAALSQPTHLDFMGSVGLEAVNPSTQGVSGQEGLSCDTSMYSSTKLLQVPLFTHHETLKLSGLFPSGPQGPSGISPASLKPLE